MAKRQTNQDDYQLDLTPFISLLSVCICFLLVTVAWYQVGSLSMKQVLGGDTSAGTDDKGKPSLWVHLESQNAIRIKVKKGKKEMVSKKININRDEQGAVSNYSDFNNYIVGLRKKIPNLNQAFILPQGDIVYDDIIKIMDGVRQSGIFNLGVSPI